MGSPEAYPRISPSTLNCGSEFCKSIVQTFFRKLFKVQISFPYIHTHHLHAHNASLRVHEPVWQCPLVRVHLYLAQVGQRPETHIVCVHLNKEKCQISMAAGCLHVRWSSHRCLWLWGRGWSFQVSVSHVVLSGHNWPFDRAQGDSSSPRDGIITPHLLRRKTNLKLLKM